MKHKKKHGFSLIEVLVVVTVIGILSTIGFNTFTGSKAKARDVARKNHLVNIAVALELYLQKNGGYIDNTPGAEGACGGPDTAKLYTDLTSYMNSGSVPQDPLTNSNYCYISVNNGRSFRLFSKLERCSSDSSRISGINCATAAYNFSVTSPDLTIAAAGATPTPSPTAVPTSVATAVPTPVPTAIAARKVFISSKTVKGDVTISGADALCASSGVNGGMGNNFKAWISSPTSNPTNRFNTFAGAYRLSNGTLIANSWADLIDGSIQNHIKINEFGETLGFNLVWTGTSSNGTTYPGISANKNCNGWTTTTGRGTIGVMSTDDNNLLTNGQWSLSPYGEYPCIQEYRLYCFEQGNIAPPTPTPTPVPTPTPTTLAYDWRTQYSNTQGPIWYHKALDNGSLVNMTWGYNSYRASYQNATPYWYYPGGYSIMAPGTVNANNSLLYMLIYWVAPQRGSARALITHKGWAWNGSSCGDGSQIGLVFHSSVNTASGGTTLQTISIPNQDTSTKTIDKTQQVETGQALMYYMWSLGNPCNDDANLDFTVTLTPN